MKKFIIVTLAALFCVAWTMPAMAKVEMEGMIQTDVYYLKQSTERVQQGVRNGTVPGGTNLPTAANPYPSSPIGITTNGIDELNIYPGSASNRLRALYHSDDKVLSGLIELRFGGPDNANLSDWYYLWLDWRPNDTFHLRVGRQPETFAIYTPTAPGLGYNDNFTLLVNYGNLHASSEDMVKAYVKFNNNIRMEFALVDPWNVISAATTSTNNFEALSTMPAEPNGTVRKENVLPRFDISFPMTFGKLEIEPSATWVRNTYDQVSAGFEDSEDVWGVSLGGKWGIGPFSLSGEATYGKNLADSHYTGAGATSTAALSSNQWARARVFDSDGNGTLDSLEDAKYFGWWVQVGFNFGPATLQAAVGMEDVSCKPPGNNNDQDIRRWGYAVGLPIAVAKGFTVMPNFIYHDRDNSAMSNTDGGTNDSTDFGNEWVLGMTFALTF